jgi:hypothetical protein
MHHSQQPVWAHSQSASGQHVAVKSHSAQKANDLPLNRTHLDLKCRRLRLDSDGKRRSEHCLRLTPVCLGAEIEPAAAGDEHHSLCQGGVRPEHVLLAHDCGRAVYHRFAVNQRHVAGRLVGICHRKQSSAQLSQQHYSAILPKTQNPKLIDNYM